MAEAVRELGLEGQAFAWTGEAAEVGEAPRLLEAAWDLAAVEDRYRAFLESFEHRPVETPADAFAAQVAMVQEWRRFPFLDPDLPPELLDHDWPGARAAAVFHDRHDAWHARAQAEWDRMAARPTEASGVAVAQDVIRSGRRATSTHDVLRRGPPRQVT